MDRKWMLARRTSDEYEQGVDEFIAFAIEHAEDPSRILCPCVNCNNMIRHNVEDVRIHLVVNGIIQQYKCWIKHGETLGDIPSYVDTEMYDEMNDDEIEDNFHLGNEHLEEMTRILEENIEDSSEMFDTLCSGAKTPLYPGCSTFSKLSAVLKLYHLKARSGWTDTSFSSLLELVKEMLPIDNVLPGRIYEAKKMLCSMGMGYEKIHACPNDCILYQKGYASLKSCPECEAPRYKENNVPAKVMWYFPIVPRFKLLFSIVEESKNLTWHEDGRKKDGLLRHPADSPQRIKINRDFPEFGAEHRNLRLALAADGMNPFSNQSSRHSTWPVILMIYNLPPELIMKRKYMMLTMLISGPKQPGNDIYVYLEPLIDDLKMMWEHGVEVYDAYCNEEFNLKALLFGTINDFPAYGNLASYATKGYEAWPVCQNNTFSFYLNHSLKVVYPGNRKFLPVNHQYRRWRKAFDGTSEEGTPPLPPTGEQILEKMEKLNVKFGKLNAKYVPSAGYKKKSRFFDLPYWKTLHIRHFLDVMHIEKNVCDSLISTLLNVKDKSKDGEAARLDLVDMKFRPELAPAPIKGTNRTYLPPACHTLSRKEKVSFCEFLSGVKVPEGYSSNIKRLVSMKDLKLIRLKSHDCHILMEHLLPVAIRSILPEAVRNAITRLCIFFSEICSKEIDPFKLSDLQKDLVV
ncbi:uncharacterized protein LOC110733242 [Chenopodium quinoa]|uniref:uncharacterized protein LOC110733242 n=1 Tax=Chenopodium quinoa TaxID=63459 RepID=UPI000B77A3C4|nr:uncharacterized protein LOC110733242 [Chenopodium quinoa]